MFTLCSNEAMTDPRAGACRPPKQMERLAAEAATRRALPQQLRVRRSRPNTGSRYSKILAPARPGPRCGSDSYRKFSVGRRPQGSDERAGKGKRDGQLPGPQSAEIRAKGEAMIQQADKVLCESWNERMWSDGEPIDPSPTIDQAVNGGFPWLEIRCARCKMPSDVDLAAMKHLPTTFVHDLASRLRCRKCAKAGRRPTATLLQLAWQPRHPRTET